MAYPVPIALPARPGPPVLRSVAPAGKDFPARAADAGANLTAPLVSGTLVVDLAGYLVTLEGRQLELSPRQVELLALFVAAPR